MLAPCLLVIVLDELAFFRHGNCPRGNLLSVSDVEVGKHNPACAQEGHGAEQPNLSDGDHQGQIRAL
jgi:hypothetical protein